MAPTRTGHRGGRPRNAWDSSRRRKLVRLYTLTKLGIDEISRVLESHSFSPSSRDVQSQLHTLFSRDYGKEYRKFRPQNEDNMKARFDRLHRCRVGRISKNCEGSWSDRDAIERKRESTFRVLDDVRKPQEIFRNYSTMKGPNLTSESPFNLSNSALVTPSLLMLDGSTLQQRTRVQIHHETESASPAIRDPVFSCHSASEADSITPSRDPGSSPGTSITPFVADLSAWTGSLKLLRKRLSGRHSDGYLQHVHAVLRSSLTESWRSSLLSFSSIVSWKTKSSSSQELNIGSESHQHIPQEHILQQTGSLLSQNIQSHDLETIRSSDEMRSAGQSFILSLLMYNQHPLIDMDPGQSDFEKSCHCWNQKVIRILVIRKPRITRWRYSARSTFSRLCCLPHFLPANHHRCKACGFSMTHRRIIRQSLKGWYPSDYDSITGQDDSIFNKDVDFYGNSRLHCLAKAISLRDLWVLQSLIRPGINLERRNTYGSTFLHVLCSRNVESSQAVKDIMSTIRQAGALGFDFLICDRRGRNIIHCILKSAMSEFFSISMLAELIAITKLDPEAPDSSRFTVKDYMLRAFHTTPNILYFELSQSLLIQAHSPTRIEYRAELMQNGSKEESYQNNTNLWYTGLLVSGHLNRLDCDGDSPLNAILKIMSQNITPFFEELIKRMMEHGVEIEMRDRKGDTALVIAAVRGLRPIVAILLEARANLHVRNCDGRGILKQLQKCMRNAKKEGHDALYAQQLSTYNLLVDAGARTSPTQEDEWQLPSARVEFLQEILRPIQRIA